MIRAKTYSDDHIIEVDFDATQWFTQASPEEIRQLADCNWGGDYAADRVAEFFDDDRSLMSEPRIRRMFDYVRATQGTRNAQGFECHVDEDDAKAWLDLHRPGWYLSQQPDKGQGR